MSDTVNSDTFILKPCMNGFTVTLHTATDPVDRVWIYPDATAAMAFVAERLGAAPILVPVAPVAPADPWQGSSSISGSSPSVSTSTVSSSVKG